MLYMNWILQKLLQENQKLTHSRKVISEYFIAHDTCIFSPMNLVEALPDLDKVTVYRTVELFKRLDIAHSVGVIGGHEYFEIHPKGKKHHHHIVCQRHEDISCAKSCSQTEENGLHHTIIYSSKTC